MTSETPYEVKPEQLQEIFHEDIKDLVFAGIGRTHKPTLVLLGGQLAAGKSTATKRIIKYHGDDIAPVTPDNFRKFHPHYSKIQQERPLDMAALTNEAMHRWNEMTQQHAHAHGYSLILEGTFAHPSRVMGVVERFAQAPEPGAHEGFRIEAVAMAVSEYRSRLDMVKRYLSEPPEEGRWADAESHDRIYGMVPQTLDTLEASPHVDRIVVTDRSGTIYYENERGDDGRWSRPPRAGEALKEARSEGEVPFSRVEASEWLASYWENAEQLIERGELGPVTAGTMLALHSDADLVAPIAYNGDKEALDLHQRWQTVQKVVFQAGLRGVDNVDLPQSPLKFLEAGAEDKARFLAAFTQSPDKRVGSAADLTTTETVRRAQHGLAPPNTSPAPPQQPDPRRRSDPGSGIER
ncbi:Zeta toxin [Marinactinospora thermotolerans DSM 45154]|uniref:UDP-N-acetylglucosamine kinase n=1 Tax=Marinactinospora thermotolerans DSM 45154 TaxID=1122192 RepID=A0A1T4M345_9ACTN|nr:zeta toxin family protein [Marinactinospora thermotolerans]SJZ61315.1 Zeta toxin [Marinactinospora thermotolerans DSM 45154]